MSALFTQCPGDTIQTGTGKIDPARILKCTKAACAEKSVCLDMLVILLFLVLVIFISIIWIIRLVCFIYFYFENNCIFHPEHFIWFNSEQAVFCSSTLIFDFNNPPAPKLLKLLV